MFLKISQNSQENTCVRASFLITLQASDFIKKETLAQAFSCEFCEVFYRTPYLQNTSGRLLLKLSSLRWAFYLVIPWQLIFACLIWNSVKVAKWGKPKQTAGGVLNNFVKLPGKHLCWCLFFNKVAGLRRAFLLKKRHQCFSAIFAKFLTTTLTNNNLLN